MVRISRKRFKDEEQILLSGIPCREENVVAVLQLMRLDSAVLLIDAAGKNGPVFQLIRELELDHTICREWEVQAEISAWVPGPFLETVIKAALQEDPENLFLFRPQDSVRWQDIAERDFRDRAELDFWDMFVCIGNDKNVMSISLRGSAACGKGLFRKLKTLQFTETLSFRKALKQFL